MRYFLTVTIPVEIEEPILEQIVESEVKIRGWKALSNPDEPPAGTVECVSLVSPAEVLEQYKVGAITDLQTVEKLAPLQFQAA